MKIIQVILSCIFFFSPVLSQYSYSSALRPDVTFGDHNDRYDITDLVDYQNKYFRTDSSADYRRRSNYKTKMHKSLRSDLRNLNKDALKFGLLSQKGRKKLAKRIKKETEKQINNLANQILLRMKNTDMRRIGNDKVDLEDSGGDIYDFNENLEKFHAGSKLSAPEKANKQNQEGYRRHDNPLGNQERIGYRRKDTAPDNLKHIGYRRMGPTSELFHYAFPINMNVQGYLIAPE